MNLITAVCKCITNNSLLLLEPSGMSLLFHSMESKHIYLPLQSAVGVGNILSKNIFVVEMFKYL